MKRDVNQVRKNISKRKRVKTGYPKNTKTSKQISPIAFPQDEEKHGYVPFSVESDSSGSNMKETFVASLMLKSMLAALLFFGIGILLRMDANWVEKPKQMTYNALTEEFPFATVNQWYRDKFGSPLTVTTDDSRQAIEAGLALPVNGTVSQSFQTNGQGIMITANEESEVFAMENGIVVFAGNKPKTGKTVIIQHPDKSNTIYGNLSSIEVHQYQSINTSEVVGKFVPSEANASNVFFAIEKENKYIDPVQVMQVDDRP